RGRRRGAKRARAVGLADAGRARAGAVALLAQLDDTVPAYGRRAGAAPLAAARAEGRVDPVAVLAHLAHAVAAHGGRGVGARRAREAEAGDARAPIAARGQVLVRVPEGAVVHRIEVQRAVVAPALVALHPAARHDRGLGDRHRPRRVGGPTARVADAGIDRRARDAVAER